MLNSYMYTWQKSNAQEANTNVKKEIEAGTHFNKISNGSITKQTREFSANSFLHSDEFSQAVAMINATKTNLNVYFQSASLRESNWIKTMPKGKYKFE